MRWPSAKARSDGESSWPERFRCANRELREIHPSALAEDQLQFRDGERQDRNRSAHRLPLRFRKSRGRQLAKVLQRFEEIVIPL